MNLLSKINKYLEEGKRFALLNVVESKGSTPRETGAKMIVFCDGSIEGTIGGGKVEFEAIKDARHFLHKNISGLKQYILTKKYNSLCGGVMKVFIETFKPLKKLVVFGAGHIGRALYTMGGILGFNITIVDNRKKFNNKKQFPEAKIIVGSPAQSTKRLKIDPNTYIVIVTHTHAHDYEILKAVIKSKAKYIGMIGSKSKVKDVVSRLKKQGISKKDLQRVFAPIGLKLGGPSPEEIALCILAEMQAVEYGAGGSLRFGKVA